MPAQSVREAIGRELRMPIEITENGRTQKVPQFEAMVKAMFVEYFPASLPMKLRCIRAWLEWAPDLEETAPHEPSDTAIANVLAALAAEFDADEERSKIWGPTGRPN